MKKFVLLLICGCLIISSHAQDEGLTFYLPFDQGAKAEKAIGDPNPLLDPPYGTIIPGIKGNAVLFNTGNVLRYFTKDNYDNACGSLELWIKYDGMPEKGRYVFMEGRKESEKTHLHISYNIGWKCLVCNHASGLYSKVSLPLEKILGTWSHFVITWDKDIGTRYYLNGRSVPYTGHSGFRGPVLNYKRESRMAETFSVGPRGSKNKNRKMAIDELKIYDRMLSEQEVKQKFLAVVPVEVQLDNNLIARETPRLKLRIKNISGKPVSGKISWSITPWSTDREEIGKIEHEHGKEKEITSVPGKMETLMINSDLQKSGRYCLNVKVSSGGYTLNRNLFFVNVVDPLSTQLEEAQPRLKLKLIKEFDCAQDYGPEEFCDDSFSKVVESPLGKYRITGPGKKWSRFAYRFFVEDVGKLHMAEMVWPDDRRFDMEVIIDSAYGGIVQVVESGVIVGGHYPNSNKLKKYRVLFYPPDKECTIMFMNWPIGLGAEFPHAAVKNVKIYRVENRLPAVKMANLPPVDKQRRVGVQDEDCSTYREFSGYAIGKGFDRWHSALLRRFDYMKYIGQNLFGHTVVHYGGTLFPNSPISRYVPKLVYPDYWLDLALYLAGQKGLKFNAGMCLLDVPKLSSDMGKTSHEEMIKGKDTICNVSWDGEFNLNWANGVSPSGYNILHPEVQEFILAFFGDFVDRYGRYPAFDGIDLWLWPANILWFGSLKSDYSDYTVGLFEKETGIKVPGEVPYKKRFTKRYVFLTKKDKAMREQWIAWRCKKVHEFWMKVYDRIQKKRPGTKLTFQCWAALGGYKYETNPAAVWKRGDVNSIYNYYREGGFDLNLFKGIPYLYVGNVFSPNRNPTDSHSIFRDYEFAEARINPFRNKGLMAVWLTNHRREFDNMNRATPMPDYWLPEGSGHPHPRKGGTQIRPNNLFRGHLEKSNAVIPNSDFYLEYYAKCLADWDVREITDGGISTTTVGAEDELRDFIRAYLTLPTEYFEQFKDVSDPVCVRHWQDRFYVVNREFYPIKVTLKFNRNKFKLLDLASDKKHKVKGKYSVSVGPYRLLSYKLPSGIKIEDVEVIMPREKVEWLEGRMKQLKEAIALAEKTGKMVPRVKKDLPWFKKELERAWDQKHYARVRKLLDSYWSRNTLNTKRNEAMLRFFDEKFQETFQNEAPPIKAMRMNSIPALDSPEWNNVPAMTEMADLTIWEGEALVAPTLLKNSIKCVYDNKSIGFLFSCPVRDKKKLAPSKSFSKAEAVELYISPNKNSKPYYHFKKCYKGPQYEKRCYLRFGKFENSKKYNPEYAVETEESKDGWVARIVIPFEELDGAAAPKKGDFWRINFVRQAKGDWQALRSANRKNGVHCPDKFSKLFFQ